MADGAEKVIDWRETAAQRTSADIVAGFGRGLLGFVIASAQGLPAGEWWRVLAKCPAESDGMRCRGMLKVMYVEVPPTVTIRCNRCGRTVTVGNWQGTNADIRTALARQPAPERGAPEATAVMLTPSEFEAMAAHCRPEETALLPLWRMDADVSYGMVGCREDELAAWRARVKELVAAEQDARRRNTLRGLQAKLAVAQPAGQDSAKAIKQQVPQTTVLQFDGLGRDGFMRLVWAYKSAGTRMTIDHEAATLAMMRQTPVMRHAQRMLTAVAEAGGAPVTQKGKLGREFCRLLAPEIEPPDTITMRSFTTEDECQTILRLRYLLQAAGLLMRRKQRFVITKRGREMLESRDAAAYAALFTVYTAKLEWVECMHSSGDEWVQETILFALRLLQRYGDVPRYAQFYTNACCDAVRGVCEPGTEVSAMRYESFMLEDFLNWFGLTEEIGRPNSFQRQYLLRRTPLFERIFPRYL